MGARCFQSRSRSPPPLSSAGCELLQYFSIDQNKCLINNTTPSLRSTTTISCQICAFMLHMNTDEPQDSVREKKRAGGEGGQRARCREGRRSRRRAAGDAGRKPLPLDCLQAMKLERTEMSWRSWCLPIAGLKDHCQVVGDSTASCGSAITAQRTLAPPFLLNNFGHWGCVPARHTATEDTTPIWWYTCVRCALLLPLYGHLLLIFIYCFS